MNFPIDKTTAFQARVYQHVRHRERPVDGLFPWFLDRANLTAAFAHVRSGPGANTPGPDGVVARDLEGRTGRWLDRLTDDLLHGRFKPSPPRLMRIPKDDGREREIAVLNLRDRVVHAALKQVLEPLLEPKFHPSSFGFRPGRSTLAALADVTTALREHPHHGRRFEWVAGADITDCFAAIDAASLMTLLREHVADEELLALLDGIVQSGARRRRSGWRRRSCGLLQGSGLSPLLCNLYLHAVDEALHRFAASASGAVRVYRYADDLLCLGADRTSLRHALRILRRELHRRRLRLGRGKHFVGRVDDGFEWLGMRVLPRRRPWQDFVDFGYVVPERKVRRMLERVDELTVAPSNKIDAETFDLARWLLSVNEQLEEWRHACLFADNLREVSEAIDDRARERMIELIRVVSGRRRSSILRDHRVELPRGFWSLDVDGARLATLAARAPRRPGRLVRKPVWQRRFVLDSDHAVPLMPEPTTAVAASEVELRPQASRDELDHAAEKAGSVREEVSA